MMSAKSRKNTFSFERLSEEHIPRLFGWLNSHRLKGLYEDGFFSHEQLKKKYLSEKENIKRFVVFLEDTPFGYIQEYEILPNHEYAEYRKEQGDTVGIDFFIGEPSFLGRGCGFLMLKEFISFLGRGISRVLADPLIGNSSIKLFEKYGFIKVGQEGNYQIFAIDIRYTARALILNDQKQLLLMKVKDNTTYDELRTSDHFWVTIGGTIEKDETGIETLQREIIEETGIEDFSVGELAFFGEHTLLFFKFPVRHFEKYYLSFTSQLETHQENLTYNEKQIFRELRWWSLSELSSTEEIVYPRCLGIELKKVMQGGEIPKEIIL